MMTQHHDQQIEFLSCLAELADKTAHGRRYERGTRKGYDRILQPVTEQALRAHLSGAPTSALVVYPLLGSETSLGVLDLDDHDGSHGLERTVQVAQRLGEELSKRELKFYPVISGGGCGVHLIVCWARPQPAVLVRRLLGLCLTGAGLLVGDAGLAKGVAEIYPKQDQVTGKCGNPIALPFGRQSRPLDLQAGRIVPLDDYSPPPLAELMNSDIDAAKLPLAAKVRKATSRARGIVPLKLAADMLTTIPADDYGEWITCGMILRAEYGDDGLGLFVAWSAKSDEKFKGPEDCERRWLTFSEDGALGIGTLFKLAKENGWEPDASAEVAEMNQRFGILTKGNKTLIIEKQPSYDSDSPIHFLGVGPFKDRVRAEPTLLGKGTSDSESKGAVWMRDPGASHYHTVDFNPSAPPGDNGTSWNVWRGFAVQPAPGDWSLFRGLIEDVIADKDPAKAAWLINWMALGVQKPAEPIGTAPVLRGAPGTGKSFVVGGYARLWRPHAITVTHPDHVTGRFNNFLFGRRLVFIDEGFFGGDRARAGVLKTRLTDHDLMVEPKGVDPFRVKNRMIFMLASNEDSVVPADLRDRRWMMFEVSDCRKEDHAYFSAIEAQMEAGGYAAMLYDLLMHDYKVGPDPKCTLPSKALFSQYIRHAGGELRYLHSLLDAGCLPTSEHATPDITTIAALWHDLQTREKSSGRLSDSALGRKIREVLGNISLGQTGRFHDPRVPGSSIRTTAYKFPPLPEARRKFEQYVGMDISWAEATDWVPDQPWCELTEGPPTAAP